MLNNMHGAAFDSKLTEAWTVGEQNYCEKENVTA